MKQKPRLSPLPVPALFKVFLFLAFWWLGGLKNTFADRWMDNHLAGSGGEPSPLRGVIAFPGIEMNRAVDLDLVTPGRESSTWLLTELTGRIWRISDDPEMNERKLVFALPGATEDKNSSGVLRLYSIERRHSLPNALAGAFSAAGASPDSFW